MGSTGLVLFVAPRNRARRPGRAPCSGGSRLWWRSGGGPTLLAMCTPKTHLVGTEQAPLGARQSGSSRGLAGEGLPDWVWAALGPRSRSLPPTALGLLEVLLRRGAREGVHATYAELAAEVGCSLPAVCGAVRRLKEVGVLLHEPGRGRGRKSFVKLLLPPLDGPRTLPALPPPSCPAREVGVKPGVAEAGDPAALAGPGPAHPLEDEGPREGEETPPVAGASPGPPGPGELPLFDLGEPREDRSRPRRRLPREPRITREAWRTAFLMLREAYTGEALSVPPSSS